MKCSPRVRTKDRFRADMPLSMADDPFDVWPTWPPPPVVLRRPELLFELLRDHGRFSCELRYQDKWGVEAMVLLNDQLFVEHRFDTREQAMQWAETIRTVIEKGGIP